MNFKHILAPTDFSTDSDRALQVAVDFARSSGATLTLLTVVPDWVIPPDLHPMMPENYDTESFRSGLKDEAEKKLAERQKTVEGCTVNSVALLSSANPATEIVGFAKKNGVDLIVVASHGRGAVERLILGSITQKLIHSGPCPILVVPYRP
jgi:nucleotide-binding universal stress UspA family protein